MNLSALSCTCSWLRVCQRSAQSRHRMRSFASGPAWPFLSSSVSQISSEWLGWGRKRLLLLPQWGILCNRSGESWRGGGIQESSSRIFMLYAGMMYTYGGWRRPQKKKTWVRARSCHRQWWSSRRLFSLLTSSSVPLLDKLFSRSNLSTETSTTSSTTSRKPSNES